MDKIYLVIIDFYENEENSIVNICSTLEKAEELKKQYEKNSDGIYKYHIDVIDLDSNQEILWDCYEFRQSE